MYNDNKLTILIPTYNRKDCLKSILVSLSKQTNQAFNVIISDNSSDYDVRELFNGLPNDFVQKCKLHVRNINSYADINAVDLFEMCETKFAWLLSDDEYLHENAVDKIFKYIKDIPNIGVYNFTVSNIKLKEKESHIINSISELISWYYDDKSQRNLEHGDLIFWSNKVFNMDMVHEYLTWSFRYIYTRVPFVATFVKMLEDHIPYCIINDQIVDYNSDNSRSWSIYEVILASRTLADIPLRVDNYDKKKLYKILTFPINYVYYLYFYESPGPANIPSFFDQIYNGIYKYCLNPKDLFILRVITILTKSSKGYYFVKNMFTKHFENKEKKNDI